MRWLALFFLLSGFAAGEEGDHFTVRLEWEPGLVGSNVLRHYPLVPTPPAGVPVPDLGDGRFGALTLANGIVLHVALDAATDPQRLYVDTDIDGDLSDETPRPWTPRSSGGINATDTVVFQLEGETFPAELYFCRSSPTALDDIALSMRIHRRGVLELGRRIRAVVVADGNADLRFDDPEHDRLYLDLDGSGPATERGRLTIGVPFHLRGKEYVANVADPLGGAVTFRVTKQVSKPTPLPYLTQRAPAQRPEPERAAALRKKALSDRDPARRVQAVMDLHTADVPGRAKIYAAVLKSLKRKEERDLCATVAKYTGYLGTAESRRILLQAFRNQSNYPLRRRIYLGARADPDGPPRALVAAALEDPHDLVRGYALWDLWLLDDPKTRKVARKVVERKDLLFGLLSKAIRILGFEADAATVTALFDWAERGKNKVWLLIFNALRREREPGAIQAMAAGLRHKSVRVRALCADLLAGIRSGTAVPPLIKAVRREKDADTQRRMAAALSNQEDPRSADVFIELAKRKDSPARSIAVGALARIGFGNRKVYAFFAKLLVSGRWEARVLVLDIADLSLVAGILANLDHKAWQVRLAAAEALGRVRVKEAIEPLLARLEREEMRRIRMVIAETLFRLTGEDFVDSAEVWRAWWADHEASFQVPVEVPVRKERPGGTVASFYGVPIHSDRVCFVLDRSSSMEAVDPRSKGKRTRLQAAAAELLAGVGRLKPNARVNVVFFDTAVVSWKKSLVPLTSANRAALKKHVEAQKPGTRTNLYDALALALGYKSVDTVFLLSDGMPNEGRYQHSDDILLALRHLNQTRRIAIHTVAIGTDSQLLRRMASGNSGVYVRR